MKTNEFLEIIFYSSGGLFLSPSALFGRNNKRASAFRSFVRFNKTFFYTVKTDNGATVYELTNECCVALFGVNESLYVKRIFSDMGIYERLLRSVMAIELAIIIPPNKKLIKVNNINYSFFNEVLSLPAKRVSVICDPLSAELIGEDVGSLFVPKLLKNKNIYRVLRSFFKYSNLEITQDKDLLIRDSGLLASGNRKLIKDGSTKIGDLISYWRIIFDELIENDNQDISQFFSKKELLDMAIALNSSLIESDYANTKDAGTNIKYHLLKLLSCDDFQAWDSLACKIKEQGALFFGRVGSGTSEEELTKLKLKEIMELVLSDYFKSMELNNQFNDLIEKDVPYYSKKCLLGIINNSADKVTKGEIDRYLIMQFKSSLILYFINHPTVLEKHSDTIEFIINNDMDIFSSIMFAFVMKNNRH